MSQICLHCYVEGRVQGVFYRDTTKRKAMELDIKGWVRNLSDGRVEVLACGEKEKVDSFSDWLWDGPPSANVQDVVMEEIPWEHHDSFEVLR